MRSSQQEAMAYTKSRQTQYTVKPQQETVDAQSFLPPYRYPLAQTISRISNTPSASTHAAMLNRSPAAGQSSNRQLVLQLQRQYGNRYVNQVVQMARRGEAEAIGESISASGVHQENKTGLPDNLKAAIETLSGISMDDVKVHYNSAKPAQLQALAYTQGTDIYVAPGRERHLPHEAWHVVQQMQGRVKPRLQEKGMAINDDAGLEYEADVIGEKAVQLGQADQVATKTTYRGVTHHKNSGKVPLNFPHTPLPCNDQVLQLMRIYNPYTHETQEVDDNAQVPSGWIRLVEGHDIDPRILQYQLFRELIFERHFDALAPGLMGVNREFQNLVLKYASDFLKKKEAFEGLKDKFAKVGIVRALNRYMPIDLPHDVEMPPRLAPWEEEPIPRLAPWQEDERLIYEEQPLTFSEEASKIPITRNDPLYAYLVRSLIWREYSSALRQEKPTEENRNVTALYPDVLQSLTDTAYQLASAMNLHLMFHRDQMLPTSGSFLEEYQKGIVRNVGEHWNLLHQAPNIGQEKDPSDLDRMASTIASAEKKVGGERWQNWTVAKDRGQTLKAYTNVPAVFSPEQNEPIKNQGTEVIRQGDKITLQQNSQQAKRSWTVMLTEQNRNNWGLSEGQGRGSFPIPFHGEMQRTQYLDPWQLGYGGNNYLACPQCMAAYYAMGIASLGSASGFRGSHGHKSSSVIPSMVRMNPVYLQHYVGLDVWQELLRLPLSELGKILDAIEREGGNGEIDKEIHHKKLLWGNKKM